MRKGAIIRKTKETSIEVGLDLDGSGLADVTTGIGFFDHMLDQLARHSLVDIRDFAPRAIATSTIIIRSRTWALRSARRWRKRLETSAG